MARAVELLELTGGARVLDLYSGLGNFTLALGARAAQDARRAGTGAGCRAKIGTRRLAPQS